MNEIILLLWCYVAHIFAYHIYVPTWRMNWKLIDYLFFQVCYIFEKNGTFFCSGTTSWQLQYISIYLLNELVFQNQSSLFNWKQCILKLVLKNIKVFFWVDYFSRKLNHLFGKQVVVFLIRIENQWNWAFVFATPEMSLPFPVTLTSPKLTLIESNSE